MGLQKSCFRCPKFVQESNHMPDGEIKLRILSSLTENRKKWKGLRGLYPEVDWISLIIMEIYICVCTGVGQNKMNTCDKKKITLQGTCHIFPPLSAKLPPSSQKCAHISRFEAVIAFRWEIYWGIKTLLWLTSHISKKGMIVGAYLIRTISMKTASIVSIERSTISVVMTAYRK